MVKTQVNVKSALLTANIVRMMLQIAHDVIPILDFYWMKMVSEQVNVILAQKVVLIHAVKIPHFVLLVPA